MVVSATPRLVDTRCPALGVQGARRASSRCRAALVPLRGELASRRGDGELLLAQVDQDHLGAGQRVGFVAPALGDPSAVEAALFELFDG